MSKPKSDGSSSNKNISKEEIIKSLEQLRNQKDFDSDEIAEFIKKAFYKPKDLDELPSSTESLEILQIRLKEILATDLEQVLYDLKAVILPNSKKYDTLIMLIARYKRFKDMHQAGLMSFQEQGLEHRTIINSAMVIINTLKAKYLKEPEKYS